MIPEVPRMQYTDLVLLFIEILIGLNLFHVCFLRDESHV